jgi:hypothetical protein
MVRDWQFMERSCRYTFLVRGTRKRDLIIFSSSWWDIFWFPSICKYLRCIWGKLRAKKKRESDERRQSFNSNLSRVLLASSDSARMSTSISLNLFSDRIKFRKDEFWSALWPKAGHLLKRYWLGIRFSFL